MAYRIKPGVTSSDRMGKLSDMSAVYGSGMRGDERPKSLSSAYYRPIPTLDTTKKK